MPKPCSGQLSVFMLASGGQVQWANVQRATVWWANVQWANVQWATVWWANVQCANVQRATVWWANVEWANVQWATVWWPNVQCANVRWANACTVGKHLTGNCPMGNCPSSNCPTPSIYRLEMYAVVMYLHLVIACTCLCRNWTIWIRSWYMLVALSVGEHLVVYSTLQIPKNFVYKAASKSLAQVDKSYFVM